MDLIDVKNVPFLSWGEVRTGIYNCVALAAPNSRIHKEWVLEFDPQTGLGKVTTLLRQLSGEHKGRVRSWVIGLGNTDLQRGQNGETEYIGTHGFDYWVNFDIWGFFDYDGIGTGAWEIAENESRLITATIARNRSLGINNQLLRMAEPPVFLQGDITPFSEGENVIVMQGQMRVKISEVFNV